MFTITNISSEGLTIIANESNFRCELAPGRKVAIPEQAYGQLAYDVGFQAMVSMGYLRIEGSPEIETVFEVPEVVKEGYDDKKIEQIMRERDITKFAQLIPKATPAMRSAFVKYAVKYSVVDSAFAMLLKKYCDVDILEAIGHARDAAAPVAPAAPTSME